MIPPIIKRSIRIHRVSGAMALLGTPPVNGKPSRYDRLSHRLLLRVSVSSWVAIRRGYGDADVEWAVGKSQAGLKLRTIAPRTEAVMGFRRGLGCGVCGSMACQGWVPNPLPWSGSAAPGPFTRADRRGGRLRRSVIRPGRVVTYRHAGWRQVRAVCSHGDAGANRDCGTVRPSGVPQRCTTGWFRVECPEALVIRRSFGDVRCMEGALCTCNPLPADESPDSVERLSRHTETATEPLPIPNDRFLAFSVGRIIIERCESR